MTSNLVASIEGKPVYSDDDKAIRYIHNRLMKYALCIECIPPPIPRLTPYRRSLELMKDFQASFGPDNLPSFVMLNGTLAVFTSRNATVHQLIACGVTSMKVFHVTMDGIS